MVSKSTIGWSIYTILVIVFVIVGFHIYIIKPTKNGRQDVNKHKQSRLAIVLLSIIATLPLVGYSIYAILDTAKGINFNSDNKIWTAMQTSATGFKLLFIVMSYLGFFVIPAWNFYHTGTKPMFMGNYVPVSKTAKRFDQIGQVLLFCLFISAFIAVIYMLMEMKKPNMDREAMVYSGELAVIVIGIGLFASFGSLYTLMDEKAALSIAYSI